MHHDRETAFLSSQFKALLKEYGVTQSLALTPRKAFLAEFLRAKELPIGHSYT